HPPVTHTLSLHDALPICSRPGNPAGAIPPIGDLRPGRAPGRRYRRAVGSCPVLAFLSSSTARACRADRATPVEPADHLLGRIRRPEEHTSELQSLAYLVC